MTMATRQRPRKRNHGHNDEDFDSNLSQHRKVDNNHKGKHLGCWGGAGGGGGPCPSHPPLSSRSRDGNRTTDRKENGSQRDMINREKLFRPDRHRVCEERQVHLLQVGTDRRTGGARPVTRSQNNTHHHPSSDKEVQTAKRAWAQTTPPRPAATLSGLGLKILVTSYCKF